MDWNGQENFSLSCELWVGTNDFNTKKNVLVRIRRPVVFGIVILEALFSSAIVEKSFH